MYDRTIKDNGDQVVEAVPWYVLLTRRLKWLFTPAKGDGYW